MDGAPASLWSQLTSFLYMPPSQVPRVPYLTQQMVELAFWDGILLLHLATALEQSKLLEQREEDSLRIFLVYRLSLVLEEVATMKLV